MNASASLRSDCCGVEVQHLFKPPGGWDVTRTFCTRCHEVCVAIVPKPVAGGTDGP